MLSTRVRRALAAGIIAVGVASCSIDTKRPTLDTTPTTAARAKASGATFHGDARWRKGALELAGSYTVKSPSNVRTRTSCAVLANPPSSRANFVVPLPRTLGAFRVSAVATASRFHGPGEYGTAEFADLRVTLTQIGSSTPVRFTANKQTTVHLTVAGDGSGTFDFAKLDGGSSGSLSGTARWTCV